jgi:transcriptional regulator with XRE-family HTH domain
MENTFGRLLRSVRERAHRSIGDLARHLDVSVVYVSDVEKGRRAPLTLPRILAAAEFLGVDPEQLVAAAAKSKGAFVLDAETASPKRMEVGAALMRGWADLSEEELEQISTIVSRRRPSEG